MVNEISLYYDAQSKKHQNKLDKSRSRLTREDDTKTDLKYVWYGSVYNIQENYKEYNKRQLIMEK